MAGRKRKFPFNYVIPNPGVSSDEDDDDIADLSEARERRVGRREQARFDNVGESGELTSSPANHEAHGEHGDNFDADGTRDSGDNHEEEDWNVARQADVYHSEEELHEGRVGHDHDVNEIHHGQSPPEPPVHQDVVPEVRFPADHLPRQPHILLQAAPGGDLQAQAGGDLQAAPREDDQAAHGADVFRQQNVDEGILDHVQEHMPDDDDEFPNDDEPIHSKLFDDLFTFRTMIPHCCQTKKMRVPRERYIVNFFFKLHFF